MTTHHLSRDTREDQQTLRRLGLVIGCFMLATAVLAITIAIVAG